MKINFCICAIDNEEADFCNDFLLYIKDPNNNYCFDGELEKEDLKKAEEVDVVLSELMEGTYDVVNETTSLKVRTNLEKIGWIYDTNFEKFLKDGFYKEWEQEK